LPESCFSPTLVRRGVGWLRGAGTDADVVVSSRVRLARNIAGFPFVARSTRAQRQAVLDLARTRLLTLAADAAAGVAATVVKVQNAPSAAGPGAHAGTPSTSPSSMAGSGPAEHPAKPGEPSRVRTPQPIVQQMLWVDVHRAPTLDRTLMVERHLISKEHARGPAPYVPQLGPALGGHGFAGHALTGPLATTGETDKIDPELAEALEELGGGDSEGRESLDTGKGNASGKGGSAKSAREGERAVGEAGEPRGVAISLPDEALSVMVNEEDHLRLQALVSGLELTLGYELVKRVDEAFETSPTDAGSAGQAALRYAYSGRFGYLTACPTNVGTGIRASVMLHLPGLKLMGEMDKVRRATRDMSLAVRGYYGEGSEAAGEFFQISNQTTLGKSETAIIAELEREIIPQIVAYERVARRLLMEKRRRVLEDKVFRALGTLRHARLLTPEEAIMLLSDVRLGVLTGLIRDVGLQQINQLVLLTQPAHLQRALGREMDQGERREARADMVRQALSA
jgi:protein arginine kinase